MSEDNITAPMLVAMAAMHGEVESIRKGSRNAQGGFDYAAADAVIKSARELLAKHGLGFFKQYQRVIPPTLSKGEIGKRCYVGDVEISGVLYHADSGGMCTISSQIPIVAMSATPHDKAAAASSTFGMGYMLLGLLNADREGAHSQVNDREDNPEPLCVGKAAPIAAANIARCDRLAEIDGTERMAVWAWACKTCKIPMEDGEYPGPKQLYVSEGTRVSELLKSVIAKKTEAGPPQRWDDANDPGGAP